MIKITNRISHSRSWLIILLVVVTLLTPLTFVVSRMQTSIPQLFAPALSHEAYEQQKNLLLSKLNNEGAQASFDYLRESIKANPSLARDCHPLLHEVGHEAYEKFDGFQNAAATYDELCNSGYLHGLIESHFLASNDIKAILQTTCQIEGVTTYRQWQCFHGVGHGAMYYTDKNVNNSIELCKKLPDNFAIGSCVNGIFMERFIVVSHSGAHATNATDIDQSLCKNQPSEYKSDCYFYAPTADLTLRPNDYKRAARMCKKVERDYVLACTRGLGAQVMKENITNPAVARDFCTDLRKKYETSCVSGALSLFINHHGSISQASELCQSTYKAHEAECQAVVKDKQTYLKL